MSRSLTMFSSGQPARRVEAAVVRSLGCSGFCTQIPGRLHGPYCRRHLLARTNNARVVPLKRYSDSLNLRAVRDSPPTHNFLFQPLSFILSVANAFRASYRRLASDPDPLIYSAGYEYIPIDVHVHILDILNLPALDPTRTLLNAVIQGFLDSHWRDYERIIHRLLEYIHGGSQAISNLLIPLLSDL